MWFFFLLFVSNKKWMKNSNSILVLVRVSSKLYGHPYSSHPNPTIWFKKIHQQNAKSPLRTLSLFTCSKPQLNQSSSCFFFHVKTLFHHLSLLSYRLSNLTLCSLNLNWKNKPDNNYLSSIFQWTIGFHDRWVLYHS